MPTYSVALRSSLIALSLAVPVLWVASARADVTCGTETCPQNYECATEAVACPAIACAPGDKECVPCTGTTQYCAPLPCASDSDCADGMVCYTQTEETCPPAPACEPGQKCATPAETTCTTEQVSACVPKYLLPCEADADCGVGFTCDVEQSCGCSGSAGAGSASSGSASSGANGSEPTPPPAADGGAADPVPPADATPDAGAPPPPDCSCQPTGAKACNLKVVACSVDEGCPAGWTCGDNPSGTCTAGPNGTTCSADPPKICLPPYMNVALGGPGRHAIDTSGSGSDNPSSGEGTGSSGTNAPPSASSSGTPEPPSTPAQDAASSPAAASSDSGGGCSVAPARGGWSGAFGFAALACAALFGFRRRQRPHA